MKPKLVLLSGVTAVLLAVILLLGGADTAHASFNPTLSVTVSSPEAGAHSGFTVDFRIPEGDVMFGAAVFFIPPGWGLASAEDIPIGAVVGEVNAKATVGLVNGACDDPVLARFTMVNSSIDPSDTVSYLDADAPGDAGYDIEDVFEDKDHSGFKDAIERYPDFMTRLLVDEDDQPLQPISRAAGITTVSGVNVLLQFVLFEPGTLIDEKIPNDPELGTPSVTLLQNTGDPDFDPVPSAITDFCSPLTSVITISGMSKDNGCTDAGAEILPAGCDVYSAVLRECDDQVDNDGDNAVNDGCPAVGDEAESDCADEEDNDGDSWINDGCPAIEKPEDSTPTDPDESGIPLFTNPPEEGTYTFTLIGAGQPDADGDGYENDLDTCPLDPNMGDPHVEGDGDSDLDGLDSACDPDPEGGPPLDEDSDVYSNRQDNCPLIPNGEEGSNQRDTDDDFIGDDCDPDPEDADAQGEPPISKMTQDVTIGPGGPPAQGTPTAEVTPPADGTASNEEGEGGGLGAGAIIGIVIGVIAAVVVLGGGAFYFMRRGSA